MFKSNFSLVDICGSLASLTCMMPCLLSPIAMTLLPHYGSKIWHSDMTHFFFTGVATIFCVSAIYQTHKRNNDPKILICFSIGLVFLLSATFILPEQLHEQYEGYLLSIGASALIIGHLFNIRSIISCCESNNC